MDMLHQLFVPLDLQLGVHAPLEKDLRPSDGQKLFDLGVDLVEAQDVGILVFFMPVKGAKFAIHPADVGVVDIAIDHKGGHPFGMKLFFAGVGHPSEFFEIGVLDQIDRLVDTHPFHRNLR